MRFPSRENLKQGIVFNAICHCGMMFIGIVTLQAWPDEGFTHSGTYNRKIPYSASNNKC